MSALTQKCQVGLQFPNTYERNSVFFNSVIDDQSSEFGSVQSLLPGTSSTPSLMSAKGNKLNMFRHKTDGAFQWYLSD